MFSNGLAAHLAEAGPIAFTAAAGLAGFSAYFSMYAFRKPRAAPCPSTSASRWSRDVHPRHRGFAILGLIGVSWLSLLGFALIPTPWNLVTLMANGLPLGMVWGLVYGYMEGRRVSEVLASMMCASSAAL